MKENLMKKHALISVFNKEGVAKFAKQLSELGYTILSTGGTSKHLQESGVQTLDIASYTNSPEFLDGRVKTLHPKIHGGILFDRNNPKHIEEMERINCVPIDVVVVNLYQFEENAIKQALPLNEAIEHIDIGGPTMLRAAAKNWQHCLPIIDPSDYKEVALHLSKNNISVEYRKKLASKTFDSISHYDHMIAAYMLNKEQEDAKNDGLFPQTINLKLEQVRSLRYGENPHQSAALYRSADTKNTDFSDLIQLQGKEISYNNLLDLDAACTLVKEFNQQPSVSIVKHGNPCGCATSLQDPLESIYRTALSGDPQSAFGGIVATNQRIDKQTAEAMSEIFVECIAAPDFSPEALKIFAKKKNLRLIQAPWLRLKISDSIKIRSISGAYLLQSDDSAFMPESEWSCVTKTQPTNKEMDDLSFAMKVAKHVKSNGIVFAHNLKTLTIGAGQMSRIDALKFAAQKAKEEGKSLTGAVMASDAFFPFRDCVDMAKSLGIRCIVQPGGSVRDQESIDAANEAGIAMLHTGERHFKH
ncbi:MAG: bifunctional phosphoribosylaminoimidazolecarboxamide formyltransferase/IMP cyclohydrolase [Bdellovibrionota bacterium]